MYTITKENFTEVVDELDELAELNLKETISRDDIQEAAPAVEAYAMIEKQDNVVTYILREEGVAKGYITFLITPDMSHSTTLYADNILYFVSPDVRGRWLGIKLYKEAEKELRERGVQIVRISSRIKSPINPVLERMGFEEEEIRYNKVLEE